MMQVASCASDWILIYSTNIYIRLLCNLCVRADCAFPPLQEDLMKLLPPFGGISRATLDLIVYQ